MTELDDGQAVTRPISVAELLAKNGTIGSPPVGGGRRRRRRGKSDAVTVAELTGEIAILGDDEVGEITDAHPGFRRTRHDEGPPLTAAAPPVVTTSGEGAESMSPDPIDDSMVIAYQSADDATSVMVEDVAEPDHLGIGAATYLRSSDAVPLGGGTSGEPAGADPSVEPVHADVDAAQQLENADLRERYHDDYEEYREHDDEQPSRGRLLLRGLTFALQGVVAVIFGAGLFLAFDELWQWNALVAMVLAILATLGLVAGVRVIRKTEDIASTLIAVVVGLLITFGPLALMHANNMI
jgi:hypothetical protein